MKIVSFQPAWEWDQYVSMWLYQIDNHAALQELGKEAGNNFSSIARVIARDISVEGSHILDRDTYTTDLLFGFGFLRMEHMAFADGSTELCVIPVIHTQIFGQDEAANANSEDKRPAYILRDMECASSSVH